jgi:hypothetical protein
MNTPEPNQPPPQTPRHRHVLLRRDAEHSDANSADPQPPTPTPEWRALEPGDWVKLSPDSEASYEVAITHGPAGMVGIYDEPPGKHIDYLNPKRLIRTTQPEARPAHGNLRRDSGMGRTLAAVGRVSAVLRDHGADGGDGHPNPRQRERRAILAYSMKSIELTTKVPFTPARLIVAAGVRYWEDGQVNGIPDNDGTLIPLRSGDLWRPAIDLTTGKILCWPDGTVADVHYKVCEAGEYWLEDREWRRAKWKGDYVPTDLLCHGSNSNGYGDYIILKVEPDGQIADWRTPELDPEQWEL